MFDTSETAGLESGTADLEIQIEALIRQASDLLQQQLEEVRRIVGSTPVESQEPAVTEGLPCGTL